MSDKRPDVGSAVIYITKNPNGANVLRDGIILGFGNQPNGKDADLPPAHIAFLDPAKRSAVLGGTEWRSAFDRSFDVPHVSRELEDRHAYRVPEDIDEVRTGLLRKLEKAQADLKAATEPKPTEPKPGPQVVAPVVPIAPAPAKK